MSAGLEASTVTPGNARPVASRTSPAMAPVVADCDHAGNGASIANADSNCSTTRFRTTVRISCPPDGTGLSVGAASITTLMRKRHQRNLCAGPANLSQSVTAPGIRIQPRTRMTRRGKAVCYRPPMKHSRTFRRSFILVLPLVLALIPHSVAGQAQRNVRKWTPPRTPWGHPDLQGIWSNATTTPLERPAEFANKPLLTDDEVAAANAAVASRRNTDQAPRAGDPGTYNEFWWERGNLLKHTAIIVDPPDGKVPPVTPEGRKRAEAFAAPRRGNGPADSWDDRNLHERCILYHGVPPLPTGYNNNYEIVQTPHYVAIRYEMLAEMRIIPL